MSAPLSGTGGGPAPGFYPDPSIPGYIRYWNGSSWVPGTSRPEPAEGEPMPSPPTAEAASTAISSAPPASRAEPAPTEETGPVFLDEDNTGAGVAGQSGTDPGNGGAETGGRVPPARSGSSLPEVRPRGEVEQAQGETLDWDDPSRLHGRRPEPASAWQADASRQEGFARRSEERVSWGRGERETASADGTSGVASADPRGGWGRSPEEATAGGSPSGGADAVGTGTGAEGGESGGGAGSAGRPAAGATPGAEQPPVPEGTFQMRAMSAEDLRNAARARQAGASAPVPDHTVGLRRSDVAAQRRNDQAHQSAASLPAQSTPAQSAPAQPQLPAQPQTPSQPPAQVQPPVQQAPGPAPAAPQQQGPPAVPQSPQQPAWAQQVQDLAGRNQGVGGDASGAPGVPAPGAPFAPQGGAEPVTPWRPPVSDPFLRAAQQEARPAALGKRFGARVVDGLFTSAVGAGVAFLFTGQAVDHIEAKIEAVRQAGRTEQVWLIDGTTGVYLAAVLGALVLFGLLYEVLPTCRWGRTLGKKLFGLRVLTMEQQDKPGFRSACTRWLVHGALSVLVVGVVNVMWCLFDRPWRQCWHDKLAGTFVSKDSGEIRL
ncbi:Uncharacterized membrane protein YckC, RDD family [Streptomyces sp. WMMB 714]|uniref:RDD family protein n=1 Tax=Streptomyces sp. WMMB 714 TaxID=1286822 RepID=UPI0005F89405|nr:RDD family protein [Streptomyces sp. WMMB 714]SCK54535.1 Uncharacterized membrane protein YckC, RDD family [Streptomyces sp. WMMB 714]